MKRTSLEQKEKIREGIKSKKSYAELALELKMKERTVRKWGQKIKRGESLTAKQGRPKVGILGSFSPKVKELIDEYRPSSGGWGAVTIKTELRLDKRIKHEKRPSISSINRYLKSKGKVTPYRMIEELSSPPYYPVEAPFDVVQLDGEGNKEVANIGALTIINLKDVYSKVYILSYPLRLASKFRHAKTEDYQNCLRLGFMEFGRFRKLQVDHESVFYDNTSTSPFPTNFHLWLLGLGIELCFTPKGEPQKQGMVERSHQTMHRQVFAGRVYESWEQGLKECWKRRNRLNNEIPSRVLNNQAPLKAFPQANHSGIKYTPSQEKKLFKQERIEEYLSNNKGWCRRISKNKVSIGGQVYSVKNAREDKETRIIYNLSTGCFDLYDCNKELIESIQIKGISFENLCGDLDQFKQWEKDHRRFMPRK